MGEASSAQTPPSRERLEALDSYRLMASVARRDFHSYWNANLGINRGRGEDAEPEFFARMSIWYSTLWVVVEGWLDLGIRDVNVDALLTDERKVLLRGFRNKTFHAQRVYPHPAHVSYMEQADSVAWTYALSQELTRAIGAALR